MIAYVSNADSGDISVLRLDAARGDLAVVQTVPVGAQVMPLAVSPDGRRLYAALRSQPTTVVSLRIDPSNGHLTEFARSPLPASMASIATDRSGRWLLAASYGSHVVSVSPIDGGGAVGAAVQVVPTGQNAHAIVADPSNRHVLVPTLGSDAVTRLAFDAGEGHLRSDPPAAHRARAGAGPRHLVFRPDGRFVYLLNELDAGVDVLACDAGPGTLSLVQTVSAWPSGAEGKPWAADLHLTPDGRFLVASERTTSTLATFRVDAASGRLTLLGHTPTETQPRGFAIDPSGRWLLAVGQRSHAATLYTIDGGSGALAPAARCPVGQNPNWVEIVDLA